MGFSMLQATIDWKTTVFAIAGGLGIFLYGINLMSDSLKKIAGSKLKMILEKSTNTPLKGIFVGIFITALIQSSSATSALVVGLVRAGLMTMPQAVGVIFGANIGTTITSLLISLDIGGYAFPIMFVGSVFIFFVKNKRTREFGKVLLGFGMLFFGLDTMGGALKQLTQLDAFEDALLSVANFPILGVLTGFLTTVLVQSSSATIGILQGLFETGSVPVIGAVAIVLGDNIGTTVTSILASIGGGKAAKRTAGIHVMFNAIGTVVFFILIVPYTALIEWMAMGIMGDAYVTSRLTISLAHVTFNLINVFILYWFIKQMIWLVSKIITEEETFLLDEVVLDETLLKQSPDLALENAKNAIVNMGNVIRAMFEYIHDLSFAYDEKAREMAEKCEHIIDNLDDKIHNYLVKIGANDLNDKQIQMLAKYIDTITDLERIGDHLDNLAGFFEVRRDLNIPLHEEAKTDLTDLYELIRTTIKQSLAAFDDKDESVAKDIMSREEKLDRLVKTYRKKHVKRIQDKTCMENEAGYYVDILSNIERIGDHCENIAINVITKEFVSHEM